MSSNLPKIGLFMFLSYWIRDPPLLAWTASNSFAFHATRTKLKEVACSVVRFAGNNDEHAQRSTFPKVSTRACPENLLALGCRCSSSSDFSSAVEVLRRAVDENPRSAMALSQLGLALLRDGAAAEGFECLVAAFKVDPFCAGLKDAFREYYLAGIEVSGALRAK